MNAPHTEGPWRWEINSKNKILHLVGGRPQFDLTIMDFTRWGMGGAVARVRDTAHNGMNIMHRMCDRPDWIAPFPGREHHANWCAGVTHPDMRLIEAAPMMLQALRKAAVALAAVTVHAPQIGATAEYEAVSRAIAKATGAPA